MYIWFHNIEGFLVKVSTHGDFSIYTPKIPRAQVIDLPSHLYQGEVEELGFVYLSEIEDINVELDDEDTEEACTQYIRQHLAELQAKETVALKLWEEIKNSPPLTGFGDAIRIGDKVTMVTVGEKADITPKAIEIIYYDLGRNGHLLFQYLDTEIDPLLQNTGVECSLQGPGWRRHFTKIEK